MLKKNLVRQLVNKVESKHGLTLLYKDAKALHDAFCELVAEELLADGEVSISGVGKLKVRSYKAHPGHNPRTGELLSVPARKRPVFIPSSLIKRSLAG